MYVYVTFQTYFGRPKLVFQILFTAGGNTKLDFLKL